MSKTMASSDDIPHIDPKQCYRNKIVYSITISPSTDGQFLGLAPKARYVAWRHRLISRLDLLRPYATYKLYPEIGKNNYLLHVHGVICFKDSIGAMLHGLPSLKNYNFKKKTGDHVIDIDTITDDDKWTTYIHKDREIMEPFTKSCKCKYMISDKDIAITHNETTNTF